MADDKHEKSNKKSSVSYRKYTKKSTSKRRSLNLSNKIADDPQSSLTPVPALPLRERTVIGQEASPEKDEPAIQEVKGTESVKNAVSFSEDVRSEADGSEDSNIPDTETEELSKLRCTSERTEVIAEREKRRRQRCADYPGLAFGSSIFSSDTLMKFSVIRNELHNILNSQLKRVSNDYKGMTVV